jgi:hypothetical protein
MMIVAFTSKFVLKTFNSAADMCTVDTNAPTLFTVLYADQDHLDKMADRSGKCSTSVPD